MLLIPLQALPNQTLQVQVSEQPCTLDVFQTPYGLFMNVWIGQERTVAGVICENLNRIVRSAYLGLVGDFAFFDTEGTSDPDYTGLGSRFVLLYLDADEVDALAEAA